MGEKIHLNKPGNKMLALFLLLITSCSVLTKPQLESIKVYAVATQEYAQYPGLLIQDYVDIQSNIFLITSPLIANPDRAASRLLAHHNEKSFIMGEAEKLDLSFSILKEYAKSLEILSDPDYFKKVNNTIENTGNNLDQLIASYNSKYDKNLPGGLGSLLYQYMVMAGRTYLDHKRGNILKEYLSKGEPLIKEISESTKGFLQKKVADEWIMGLDLELESSHAAIRRHILIDTLSYSSHSFSIIHLDTQVSKLYGDIDQLKKLNNKLIASIDELYLAHKALNLDIRKKRKAMSILSEVTLYVSKVYGIIDLYRNLSKE